MMPTPPHYHVARDLAGMSLAGAVALILAASVGTVVALAVVIVAAPVAICIWLERVLRRPMTDVDRYCDRLDQELDARRQLRVVRTVRAEPRPRDPEQDR